MMFWLGLLLFSTFQVVVLSTYVNYELKIGCEDDYRPDHCANQTLSSLVTVEDFERCAPSRLSKSVRNYFWGISGRGLTYKANFDSFKKIKIIPKVLRNVTRPIIATSVLGQAITFPVGLSPVPSQTLASPVGEISSALAAAKAGTVMILSCLSSTSIENVAEAVKSANVPSNQSPIIWMQIYFFKNTDETIELVRKAEENNYKAIVVTVGAPMETKTNCQNKVTSEATRYPNLRDETFNDDKLSTEVNFNNITWLRRRTRLPIVVKGILTGEDAVKAIKAGARAILVSNNGGRQLDGAPAAIDALPHVVNAVRQQYPRVEIYVDGGIRNGFDVYKAIARGAKAVFIGRPVIWGLAMGGEEGVNKVLNILKSEFNETMMSAGVPRFSGIGINSIFPRQEPIGLISG